MTLDINAKRAYQRQWWRGRRRQELHEIAQRLGQDAPTCAICGETDPGRLRKHHVDPSAKLAHNTASWAKVRRDAENAKCVLLCAACHRQHHMGKFTREQAAAIKSDTRPAGQIAAEYGAARWTIRCIQAGLSYQNVPAVA